MKLILSKEKLAIPYVRQTVVSEVNARLQGVSRFSPTLRSRCKQTGKLEGFGVTEVICRGTATFSQ